MRRAILSLKVLLRMLLSPLPLPRERERSGPI